MKKSLALLLAISSLVLLLAACKKEQPTKAPELEYVKNADGTYTVLGIGGYTDTELVIPDTYNGAAVTAIGDRAFYHCTSFTSVIIPDSVTRIGDYAFYSCSEMTDITIGSGVASIGIHPLNFCTNLTSIEVSSSNPVYQSNGNCLIEKASKTLIAGCQSSVIPTDGSVTKIGDLAFYECGSLTSIKIPDCVTSIGNYAFEYCTNLTSVTLGKGLKSIGEGAFLYCGDLADVTLPESLEHIGASAFGSCKGFTSMVIPDRVTEVGASAFSGCDGLTSVAIGTGVAKIDDYVFSGCGKLASIVLPDTVTSIGDRAFYHCTSLTKVYYLGTAEAWAAIQIDQNYNTNAPLTNATRYDFSATPPATSGNYWRYVDGVPTAW